MVLWRRWRSMAHSSRSLCLCPGSTECFPAPTFLGQGSLLEPARPPFHNRRKARPSLRAKRSDLWEAGHLCSIPHGLRIRHSFRGEGEINKDCWCCRGQQSFESGWKRYGHSAFVDTFNELQRSDVYILVHT